MNPTCAIHEGDCLDVLRGLPSESAHCCVTSPPYFQLRNYGHPGQIGLEKTPAEFIARLVAVFEEVRRVLRADGTCWVNMGDSYAAKPAGSNGYADGRANRDQRTSGGVPFGLKPKDLVGIPWMLAFALRDSGWYLRQDIIWHKPNPMPESVRDRCTKAHEYLFLLTKSERYFWDEEAMQEPAGGWNGSRFEDGKNADAPWERFSGSLGSRGSAVRRVTAGRPFSFLMTYAQKLRDPRWQRKRLERLSDEGWRCTLCESAETELRIHHRFYEKGRDPWDYDDDTLLVLCAKCHQEAEEARASILRSIEIGQLVELSSALRWLSALPEDDRAMHESRMWGKAWDYAADIHALRMEGKTE